MLSARLHVQKDFQLIDIGFFTPSLSRAHIQSVLWVWRWAKINVQVQVRDATTQ